MRSPGDADHDAVIGGIHCQWCTAEVDPTTTHLVHRVPEHGTDDVENVFYCSRDCFNSHLDSLINGGGA
jgi:hypothetical protein